MLTKRHGHIPEELHVVKLVFLLDLRYFLSHRDVSMYA